MTKNSHKESDERRAEQRASQRTRTDAAQSARQRQRLLKGLVISLGLAFCLMFSVSLYPVFREYYIASRAHEKLLAEYAAVLERNERVALQIANLQTAEGIEDRAREQFGWVREGEEAVNITGLTISDSSTVLPAAVASGSIVAEATWWTDFLDMIFGVVDLEPEPETYDPFIR